MEFKNVIAEWQECRKTVARFDDYLLRLRLLGFSVFTLTFTAIVAAVGSESSPEVKSSILQKTDIPKKLIFAPTSLLIALFTLSLFVLAIYILDRYYERMLLIAVLRASRLEAHRLEGFRIGLTTEIEYQKTQQNKPTFQRKLASASLMVNFVYFLISLTIIFQYVVLIIKTKYSKTSIPFSIGMAAMILMGIIANSLLREPNRRIAERSDVVNSPVIMSRDEIKHEIAQIASKIKQWLSKKGANELHIVSILVGARPFTDDLVLALNEANPRIKIFRHLICMEAPSEKENQYGCKINYGHLDLDSMKSKFVLIVDDLLDTGATLIKVCSIIKKARPRDMRTAVLIKKYKDSSFSPSYIGFELDQDRTQLAAEKTDCWLFGYGMDYKEHYREIEHIGWVKKKRK
jgi:hypoxanthine phosphoribosyltransferase